MELKNTMTKVKHSIESLSSTLNQVKRISGSKIDHLKLSSQSSKNNKKELKKHLQGIWDTIKSDNLHIMGEEEKDRKHI